MTTLTPGALASRAAEFYRSVYKMIFTDHYHPSRGVSCFVCGKALCDWTGFDGPCLGLTFHQGRADPDLPEWAEEPALNGGPILDPAVRRKRLPDHFVISSQSCGCPFPNRVQGQSREGVWMHSFLLTGGPEDRRWLGPERKEDFHRRMNWLEKRNEQGDADNFAALRG
jgi:hypothetical protein